MNDEDGDEDGEWSTGRTRTLPPKPVKTTKLSRNANVDGLHILKLKENANSRFHCERIGKTNAPSDPPAP